MKKSLFIAIIALGAGFSSCQKDENILPNQSEMTNLTTPPSDLDGDTTINQTKAGGMIEYQVSPKFGKPNSTYYYFKVYDPSGALPLSVKFNDKAYGTITYKAMSRSGSYWVLSTTIATNGWYDWKYVYRNTLQGISSNYYQLCNTYNTFSSTSSIRWPFGADGSSYYNRYGWIGAMEGGCGSGWNQGGHHYFSCGADDSYAEDWNKNCSSSYADDGATVRSPLDGKVVRVFIDSPSNHNGGYGNAVDVEQGTANGNKYVFRIAHLKYAPSVSVNTYVRAGYTKIGNIGMSGGTSSAPHGHCVLYNSTSGCNLPAKFLFNAQ